MNQTRFDTNTFNKSTNECDEENIIIVPSSELIPDEYDHTEPKKGYVTIFHSRSEESNKNLLLKTLSRQNYNPKVFRLSKKEEVLNHLSEVANEDHKNTTCLIIFFLSSVNQHNHFVLDNDTNQIIIKDVWTKFTGNKCTLLKNKPKIFIFQASKKLKSKLEFDHITSENAPKGAYDVPSEADMLLVFNKVEKLENQEDFIQELCKKITKFGKRDDVINLISRTSVKEQRPIVISTLTRKFYFEPCERRDHFYDIHRNHDTIMNELKDLRKNRTSNTSIESGTEGYEMETDSPVAKVLLSQTVKNRVLAIDEKNTQHKLIEPGRQNNATQTSTLPLKRIFSKASTPSSETVQDTVLADPSNRSIELGAKTHAIQTNPSRVKKIQEQTSTKVSNSSSKTVKDIVFELESKEREAKAQSQIGGRFKLKRNKSFTTYTEECSS